MNEQALVTGEIVAGEAQVEQAGASDGAGDGEARGTPAVSEVVAGKITSYRVRNETPKRLNLEFINPRYRGEESATLGPLEEREWDVDANGRVVSAFQHLQARGLLAFTPLGAADKIDLGGLAYIAAIAVFAYWMTAATIIQENAALATVLNIYIPATAGLVLLIGLIVFILGSTTVLRQVQNLVALLLVLLAGTGITGATIYYFGDGRRLLAENASLALLGRGLQFTFIIAASIFPALLYFWFDRSRLGTLRRSFERVIFRLDPTVHNLREVYTKYGDRLDELFGNSPLTARGKQSPGTRSPIWLAVLVISIGWILVLLPVSGSPAGVAEHGLLAYFLPDLSVIGGGFLGAYYFALFSVARRYTRGDLQPKAYSHIVTRIFIVFILAWVLSAVIGDRPGTLALVFVVGVLPETFWMVMGEVGRNEIWGRFFDSQQEKDPLTNLEGIDTYDRARLAEEGVTNVESLAHHDLVDLILLTRIPVARLIYWVDQAILYIHLPDGGRHGPAAGADEGAGGSRAGTAAGAGKGSGGSRPGTAASADEGSGGNGPGAATNGTESGRSLLFRQRLYRRGIRTATEFMQVYEAALERKELDVLCALLEGENGAAATAQTQLLYDTLSQEEWLPHIQQWRARTVLVEEADIVVDEAGQIRSIVDRARPPGGNGAERPAEEMVPAPDTSLMMAPKLLSPAGTGRP